MDLLQYLSLMRQESEKASFLHAVAMVKVPTIISFLNAHAFVMAGKDGAFAADLGASDYLLRDGVGVAVLLGLLGREAGLNMNGTDFIPEIIKSMAGKKIALCGTREPWLTKAADMIKEIGGNVILKMDGFQQTEAYLSALQDAKADLVILAMGMPRQEALSIKLKETLSHPAVIVNGGAILDFMAGRFPRAPLFWRKMHMEWLYRLIQEPRRLARRYIIGGFEFGMLALRLVWAERKTK